MNAGSDGSGQIEFRRWETPVETRRFGILDVTQSVDNSVIVRVEAAEGGVTTFAFSDVLGLRVQDEGGLTQLWAARSEAVQGCATFMVRNHAWARESPLTFLATDGWCFVLTTDDTCVEVVCSSAPTINT